MPVEQLKSEHFAMPDSPDFFMYSERFLYGELSRMVIDSCVVELSFEGLITLSPVDRRNLQQLKLISSEQKKPYWTWTK
ncbi:hypothetical protein BV898_11182 [Hypsibius exemplaris]|uniref:Uncharacterized protein n=1 Tax=Hypsibius exemplaris TaxID=2072580 RepID=A0A1W0WHK2_HYPEX|nr:hypothetical protein BV898_11182 [Hypsibius exemplaris]